MSDAVTQMIYCTQDCRIIYLLMDKLLKEVASGIGTLKRFTKKIICLINKGIVLVIYSIKLL